MYVFLGPKLCNFGALILFFVLQKIAIKNSSKQKREQKKFLTLFTQNTIFKKFGIKSELLRTHHGRDNEGGFLRRCFYKKIK